ncbi:MAG TPA: GNAT family N-acetyltransferase [Alphaproteobacteria bacterium]|nr:GNAT family N-acetyltransferase [Alphaproteobacteria bacterium]
MTAEDIPLLSEFARGHVNEPDYFQTSFDEQRDGKRAVFMAFVDGVLAGYVHYNRHPKYQPFRSLNIPEIQDLYVASVFRRQGIGEALVRACEAQAQRETCSDIGIGVGVGSEFGAAQRLYMRLGYLPDGAGVVFDRDPVSVGEVRPVDDRLCLMVVKSL